MNRIAERQEQAFLSGLLRLAGEAASMESADRLFGDVKISVGGSPLHATAGILYLLAYDQDISTASRNYGLHFSHDPRRILALSQHGYHDYSASKGVMVGDLLDRQKVRMFWRQYRVPCRYFGEDSLALDNLRRLGNWCEQLGQDLRVSWLANHGLWDQPAFAIPNSPDLQKIALLTLIRSLDSIQNSVLLEGWLEALIGRRVSLPEGMLPDSPALAIIRRILDIDVDRGVKSIRALLRPSRDLPFRFGYFQLSLTGVLLAKLSTASSFSKYRSWIWAEIDYLREEGINSFEDFWLGLGLLAALLAIGITVEDDTVQAISWLDTQIARSLEKSPSQEDKKLFLRFLGDSLSQSITASNLPLHLSKLMTFFKHGKDEPSLVRQQNKLLRLIRSVFEPARAMLTTS